MPSNTRADIDDFLKLRRIAIVGVSRNPLDYSRMVFKEFRKCGYVVTPVNPAVSEIDGIPCLPSIAAVSPPAEGALLLTPVAAASQVAQECLDAGVRFLWLRSGEVSLEGVRVIFGECPLMWLPNPQWFHSFHRGLRRVFGSLPS